MTHTWFYLGLGVAPSPFSDNHALALMLFFLVLSTFTFFVSPLMDLSSRRDEYEADAFAAKHADASQFVSALVKLFQDNAPTLTPDPVYSTFHCSRPTASQRVERLMRARAARHAANRATPISRLPLASTGSSSRHTDAIIWQNAKVAVSCNVSHAASAANALSAIAWSTKPPSSTRA